MSPSNSCDWRGAACRQLLLWSGISAAVVMGTTSVDCSGAEPQSAGASSKITTSKAEPAAAEKFRPLFDGKSLKNWTVTDFGGQGEVEVKDGALILQQGSEITGISWTGEPLPNINYEISLEAQRIDGSDFFCGIVFPVKEKFCSFVVGGWGGGVVGLSSIDNLYATENETASFHTFKDKTWYKIRLRVAEKYIQAWIDDKMVIDLDMKGHEVSLHPAMLLAKPLGISCFSTVAAVRNIQFRGLKADELVHTPKAD